MMMMMTMITSLNLLWTLSHEESYFPYLEKIVNEKEKSKTSVLMLALASFVLQLSIKQMLVDSVMMSLISYVSMQ